MKIPVHNWETQQLDYEEYPDALFAPFLVWLLTTSAWYDDPRRVRDKVLILRRQMADHRNPVDTHHEADAPPAPAEALAERRRANLAKARAIRAEKKRAREAVAV